MLTRIEYELAKTIWTERLREAEQERLVQIALSARRTRPRWKWRLNFRLNRSAAPKVAVAHSKG